MLQPNRPHATQNETCSSARKFFLTGCIRLNEGTCQDLLAAADMLGLSDVLEVCCVFLKEQLHPSNAIGRCLCQRSSFAFTPTCCTFLDKCGFLAETCFVRKALA